MEGYVSCCLPLCSEWTVILGCESCSELISRDCSRVSSSAFSFVMDITELLSAWAHKAIHGCILKHSFAWTSPLETSQTCGITSMVEESFNWERDCSLMMIIYNTISRTNDLLRCIDRKPTSRLSKLLRSIALVWRNDLSINELFIGVTRVDYLAVSLVSHWASPSSKVSRGRHTYS